MKISGNISALSPKSISKNVDYEEFLDASAHTLAISNPEILEHVRAKKDFIPGSISNLSPKRIIYAETNSNN